MITDKLYQTYAGSVVTEVPEDNLKHIINVLIEDSALNMGCNYEVKIVDRIIEFVQSKDFNYLPVAIIASAFNGGSLGKFGAGRLVPKTVYDWLNTVAIDYRRRMEHEKRLEQLRTDPNGFNLHKFPAGQAIVKKMDWLKSGVITEEEWDKIPLLELAGMIADGFNVKPKNFGIDERQ